VEKVEDLQPGMKLPGIVTNVTAFGAFVDIGVHQDGLVHISQISDDFVKNPAEFLKVGQKVQTTVMEIDLARKRIALSLKTKVDLAPRQPRGTGAPGANREMPQKRYPLAPHRPQKRRPLPIDRGLRGTGNEKPRNSRGQSFSWTARTHGGSAAVRRLLTRPEPLVNVFGHGL